MTDAIDIKGELRELGLAPATWTEALAAIKGRLSPADGERFSRAHKNFVGYRSEATLASFYGTVFELGLQNEINGFRFGRLAQVLEDLLANLPPGKSVLDVGAGAGYVSTLIAKHCAPRVLSLQDTCSAVRDELLAQGYSVLPHPLPPEPDEASRFEVILCVDSLGEVNADDDGLLSKPGGVPAEELPELMEQRYGFAQKLAAWKPWLAPGGCILLWEPFAYPEAFQAVATFLGRCGWDAKVIARAPGRNYLEILAITRHA